MPSDVVLTFVYLGWEAVGNWLLEMKMQKYINQFHAYDMEDFLTLPFLREEALEGMGVRDSQDRSVIYKAITKLWELSKYECRFFLCFPVRIFMGSMGADVGKMMGVFLFVLQSCWNLVVLFGIQRCQSDFD